MGKNRRRILLVAVLLLAVGCGIAAYRSRHQPIARWTLDDGTELRLEYMTYGTQHRVRGAGAAGAWAARMANRWLHAGLPYYDDDYIEKTELPCPVLWFTSRNLQTGKLIAPKIGNLAVLTGPGDFWVTTGDPSTACTAPFPHTAYSVPAYPRRAENFRLRLNWEGQIVEATIPNPVRGQRFEEWKPEPLPQTKRVGIHEFTLSRLLIWPGEPPMGLAHFSPRLEIHEASGETARGLDVRIDLLDATGNKHSDTLPMDEPAWKVRAKFRRNGDYPFASDEGLTLGPVAMPGPGEYGEFEIPAAEKKNGIRLAAILGVGHFVWQDGKFITAETALASPDRRHMSGAGNGFDENVSQPELVLLIEGTPAERWVNNSDHIVVQVHVGGKGYKMSDTQSGSKFDGKGRKLIDKWFAARWDERGNRISLSGPISIQTVPVENETVEFLVAPPKLPEPSQ